MSHGGSQLCATTNAPGNDQRARVTRAISMQDQAEPTRNDLPKNDAAPIKERITRILRVMAEVPALDDVPADEEAPAAAPPRFYQLAFE